jgi:hypothetical protein
MYCHSSPGSGVDLGSEVLDLATADELTSLVLSLPEHERVQVFEALQKSLPRHPMEVRLKADSRTLLEAIARANDFTIRGIEGIIAEAVFALDVLPTLKGWVEIATPPDAAYDFLLRQDGRSNDVRVQVKMQRRRRHAPWMANEVLKKRRSWPATSYVVEVQRTRGGKGSSGRKTRPYRFGEFDVLAVSLGASTGYWGNFAYTVADWLLPEVADSECILKFQPVDPAETSDWTRSFERAIEWLDARMVKTIHG